MTDPPPEALASRLIELSSSFDPHVHPRTDAPVDAAFAPFTLPFFPVSQSAWLTCLADLFYARHQRIIASLLVLHLPSQEWTMPLLPTQECRIDGVSFRILGQDLVLLPPACRIGGSFQMAHAATPADAAPLVPAIDGLHIVYSLDSRQSKHCFLRANGQLTQVLPESVIIDDWRRYLFEHRERITLG
jgi:hypothetical protein